MPQQIPQYQCTKQVQALKIAALETREDGSAQIAPVDTDFPVFDTRKGWASTFKGDESDMGYYVVYKDGYTSWSPTQVFEEGYERIGF